MGKKKASKFNDVPSSGRVNRRDAHRDKVAGDALAPSTVIPTEEDDDDVDIEQLVSSSVAISVRVCLWEFGQNDPNRDSGSKVCRLGYATRIRVGQSFLGIILSSEASTYLSPQDAEIICKHGVAGINCSWNRLNEIPFDALGKHRNHRLLPLLFAANSVNYGKPFKMNTAEAIAATLYIAGFKQDAEVILAPFGYGAEFLRLNLVALEAYSSCKSGEEVALLHEGYIRDADARSMEKLRKKDEEQRTRRSDRIGGYMDDMDLPPSEEEDLEEDGDENDGDRGEGVVGSTYIEEEGKIFKGGFS